MDVTVLKLLDQETDDGRWSDGLFQPWWLCMSGVHLPLLSPTLLLIFLRFPLETLVKFILEICGVNTPSLENSRGDAEEKMEEQLTQAFLLRKREGK